MSSNSHIEMKRLEITDEIVKNGIHLVAIADTDDCPCCRAEGAARKHKNRNYTKFDDGYIYSVGFHGLGLPEMLIFVGPAGRGDNKIKVEELERRINDAADFIRHVYETRATFVFNVSTAHGGNVSRERGLGFIIVSEQNDDIGEETKHKLMSHTVGYYDTTDFKTVVFKLAKINFDR